ncbi:hypothetical protein FQN51_007592 [Onygenales sp. PD_10]|nr:hypothetical protein FQN51_007592 [Onygenales sp. PD_10]
MKLFITVIALLLAIASTADAWAITFKNTKGEFLKAHGTSSVKQCHNLKGSYAKYQTDKVSFKPDTDWHEDIEKVVFYRGKNCKRSVSGQVTDTDRKWNPKGARVIKSYKVFADKNDPPFNKPCPGPNKSKCL